MLMHRYRTLGSLVATLLLASASAHSVKGEGAVTQRTIEVAAFHGIVVEGAIDVVLTPGQQQQVVVEAQANLIDLVRTKVADGVWTISTTEGYSTDKPFIVHITAPVVDDVAIRGSGDVHGEGTFQADGVKLSIEGSGDIQLAYNARNVTAAVRGSGDMQLSGKCDVLAVAVQGSGDVLAKELKANSATASSAGSGDIAVFALKSLVATTAGSGDIVYCGDPSQVQKQSAGSGEIRHSRSSGTL